MADKIITAQDGTKYRVNPATGMQEKIADQGSSPKSTDTLRAEMMGGSKKKADSDEDLQDKPDDSALVKLSKKRRREAKANVVANAGKAGS